MGNRDALLTAALRCLLEKGYARTTSRDIASAAGTSLAAIGYHYGTTRQLLNQAVYLAVQRWGDEVAARLGADRVAGQSYLGRFAEVWARILDSMREDRPLWAASLDMIAQAEHVQEVRQLLREGMREARTGAVALFDGVDEQTVDERQAKSLGSFYHALISGVLIQQMVAPEDAPSAEDLAEALRLIAGRARED